MTYEQLEQGKVIKDRIQKLTELEYMLNLKSCEKVFIKVDFSEEAQVEIPKHSKDVILALCIKERKELEKELENL